MALINGEKLEKWIFSGIVFNMSWEDPYVDKYALNIGPGDTTCTIASGGCNTLSQLCFNPDKVIAVEQNDAQASLLELKMAGVRELEWRTFSDVFGDFDTSKFPRLYPKLRPHLSPEAQAFWDKKGARRMMRRGLHRAGKNGLFLRMVRLYLESILDMHEIEEMFEYDDLNEVRRFYDERIAPSLFTAMLRIVCEKGKPWFYLAGVHPAQIEAVEADMPMFEYLKVRMRELVCNNLPRDNYFLYGAVFGRWRTRDAVPPYLRECYWETLTENIDKLEFHRGWLHEVLDSKPEGTVDKYSLLDIFDWMHDKPEIFDTVLRSVIRAAKDGGLLVYRSGRLDLEPPEHLREALPQSEEQQEISRKCLHDDMSGIYMDFKLRSIDKSKVPEPTAV